MHTKPRPKPLIPVTPLRILRRSPEVSEGPFYVSAESLATNQDLREIDDAEIDALAHLIYNAYREWKEQSPTSGFPASDK